MAEQRSVLVVDVGGNNVKCWLSSTDERRKTPSGRQLTGTGMVDAVLALTRDWAYDVVSLGVPGPVADNRLLMDPVNLGPGWAGLDFAELFGRPTRVVNDAVMQALGSYEGGRMLFLGLGTGLGNTLVVEGIPIGMELGHLPYRRKRTFEDHVGQRGLDRFGKKAWRKFVADVVRRLKAATVADYVVIGGGNAKLLDSLPEGCRRGDNKNAFRGGLRLWEGTGPVRAAVLERQPAEGEPAAEDEALATPPQVEEPAAVGQPPADQAATADQAA
jgi:polyphosphate glucokinase